MNVYVVMGNDYPDSVFSTEEKAEAHCERMRKVVRSSGPKIYWRVYEFTVDRMEAK